jgi:hypothetical protein
VLGVICKRVQQVLSLLALLAQEYSLLADGSGKRVQHTTQPLQRRMLTYADVC